MAKDKTPRENFETVCATLGLDHEQSIDLLFGFLNNYDLFDALEDYLDEEMRPSEELTVTADED